MTTVAQTSASPRLATAPRPRSRWRWLSRCALALSAVLWTAGSTFAQDGRATYERGVAALQEGEAERALTLFRAALDAEPHPDHALALAATLQQTGELTEAIALYERLLAGEFGSIGDAMRAAAERARALAEEGRASLRVTGPVGTVVEVDGEPRERLGEHPLELRLDPGEYRVRGRTDDGTTEVFVLTLGGSEVRSIELPAVEPTERVIVAPPAEAPPPESPPARRSRGPWIVMGLALAPLAVGITTAVLYQRRIDRADAAPSLLAAEPDIRDAERFGPIATASFAVAGALALTGLVWALVDRRRVDEGAVSLRLAPTGLLVDGTF